MAEKLRVGIIGLVSSYSLHYGQSLSEMDGVDFVGLAHLGRDPKYIRDALNLPWLSKYPKTLEAYAKRFGADIYETANELIDRGKPNALCICTEDYLHQRYALLAIEHGIHALLPKPFAQSIEEAEAIFSAANERQVVAFGVLPHRFRPPAVTARSAIEEGAIGRPITGHFAIAHHLTLGGWKSDTSMAAGPELEVGFYAFDLARMLMMSEPVSVMGLGVNLDHRGIPYIDNGKCLLTCQNGAIASVDLVMSLHQPFAPAQTVYVVGDGGALTLEDDAVVIHTPDGITRRDIPKWQNGELETWLNLCRGREDGCEEQTRSWQTEGLRTLDLILAYKQSYQTGETICLNRWEG